MTDPLRILTGLTTGDENTDPHLTQEWLVTNGLGGYASGTVVGPNTRRYHGLLIAGLPNPLGRFLMLQTLSEQSGDDLLHPSEFRLEAGLPVWLYKTNAGTLEKRVHLPHKQNTVYITYKLLDGPGGLSLSLRPGLNLRSHDGFVDTVLAKKYVLTFSENRFEISGGPELPVLRMTCVPATTFSIEERSNTNIFYSTEKNRGYPFEGPLWSPGYFRTHLQTGPSLTLVASTESWETMSALDPAEAYIAELERRRALLQCSDRSVHSGIARELVLAADQFLITPVGRQEDAARARAAGDEPETVIAGYHWFTDWGRDTMISLEGLTLLTGRAQEARWILHTFAHYVKDGLIPNMFPEGEKEGLYHTADASLWFFHAVARYMEYTGDGLTLQIVLPKLIEIADAHLRGTRFGIHVDPADGLLTQGQEGYQLTWMDAKVDGWVVTPRRGKAVEINALWYNALCLLASWGAGEIYAQHAALARQSFNRRFWNAKTNCLYDVVDGETGDDPAIRPNQIFAISLPNPVLDPVHWQAVMDVATRDLLTPVGLRSLSPSDPDYKPKYFGDLRSRDAAYHQGSVWAWLIGPYVDARLKVYPDQANLDLLKGFAAHLDQSCVGSISEIFDAEEPHTARACIAQAWSVAEVLRCWAKLDISKTSSH